MRSSSAKASSRFPFLKRQVDILAKTKLNRLHIDGTRVLLYLTLNLEIGIKEQAFNTVAEERTALSAGKK